MSRLKRKTGPKPKPAALTKRHAVMVRYDDGELLKVQNKAQKQPLATFIRERSLA